MLNQVPLNGTMLNGFTAIGAGTLFSTEQVVAIQGGVCIGSDPIPDIVESDHADLAAFYTMDNISGATLNDETANGRDATITGATATPGQVDNALRFDGTSDKAVEDSDWDTILGSEWEISLWIDSKSYDSGSKTFINFSSTGEANAKNLISFSRTNSTTMRLFVRDDNNVAAFVDITNNVNTGMHFFSLQRDGDTIAVYQNEAAAVTDTAPSAFGTFILDRLIIGAFYNDSTDAYGNFAEADIDQVRPWVRKLTDDEHADLFAELPPGDYGAEICLDSTMWQADQNVLLRISDSGSMWTAEQDVNSVQSGSLWTVEQTVNLAGAVSNVTKFGWDAHVYVGGDQILPGNIFGEIVISRTENEASLLDITLNNYIGVQDLDQWHGKTITVDVERSSGLNRLYTGTVDIPEIDLINQRITLRCTDRRDELINAQFENELKFIGRHSEAIFDKPETIADELRQRLETTPKVVDFDAHGLFTISSFFPKSSADFTLADAGIYRRDPTVEIASRGRLINRVNIEFDWRYVRLRHRERQFKLQGPTFCEVSTTPGLAFISSAGITSNVNTFAWPVKPSTLVLETLPDGGWYDCGQGQFIWNPSSSTWDTNERLDANGDVITDTNGNPVTDQTNRIVTSFQEAFATSATWTAARRFAQDITEKFNITVSAPQSIAQYGLIETNMKHGKSIDHDTLNFEGNIDYRAPDDFTSSSGDWFLDKPGTDAEFTDALQTVAAIAETRIKKSHRDNHVTIETPIWPEVDLKHTIETTAGIIAAKGKVSNITHTLDISDTREASTEVTFSLSRAQGSQSEEDFVVPSLSAALLGEDDPGTSLIMFTHSNVQSGVYGFDDNDVSNGAGGFGAVIGITTRTGMTTPPIDDPARNQQLVENASSYDVEIQNDTLTVTFS